MDDIPVEDKPVEEVCEQGPEEDEPEENVPVEDVPVDCPYGYYGILSRAPLLIQGVPPRNHDLLFRVVGAGAEVRYSVRVGSWDGRKTGFWSSRVEPLGEDRGSVNLPPQK